MRRIDLSREVERKCRICQVTKPVTEFPRNIGSRRYRRCRFCESVARIERYRASSPERKAEDISTFRLQRYGLTIDSYHAMAECQDFLCAICQEEPIRKQMLASEDGFAIDHSHITGKVRGLLCDGCNKGIGFLGDNPQVVYAAARYLESAL